MGTRTFWGVLLVVLGCASLFYTGISYPHRVTILHIGSLVATANRTKTIPLSPVLGIVVIVSGGALLAWGRRRRAA